MEYIYNCILDDRLYRRQYTVTNGIAKEKVYTTDRPFRTYRYRTRGPVTAVTTATVLPLLLSPTVAIIHWSQIELPLPHGLPSNSGIAYYGIGGYDHSEVNLLHLSNDDASYRNGKADFLVIPDDGDCYGDMAVTETHVYYRLPIGWVSVCALPQRLDTETAQRLLLARS